METTSKKNSSSTLIALGVLFVVFLILLFTGVVGGALQDVGITVPAWMLGQRSTKAKAAVTKIETESIDLLSSDLEAFSLWVKDLPAAEIEVIRHARFELVCLSENPVHTSKLEYGIRLVQGEDRLVDADVGKRLVLHLGEDGSVKGKLGKLRKKSAKEWTLEVNGVGGMGTLGLSIDGMPPLFYDVELTRIWAVPVRACSDDRVFVGNAAKGLSVGDCIVGSGELCGYRVIGIGVNCVWFEVLYSDSDQKSVLPTNCWPDFGAVDFAPPVPPETGRLVFRKNRYFWPGEAIRLPSSQYCIQIHELIRPNVAHFRLLDQNFEVARDLVCVVVRPLP